MKNKISKYKSVLLNLNVYYVFIFVTRRVTRRVFVEAPLVIILAHHLTNNRNYVGIRFQSSAAQRKLCFCRDKNVLNRTSK